MSGSVGFTAQEYNSDLRTGSIEKSYDIVNGKKQNLFGLLENIKKKS